MRRFTGSKDVDYQIMMGLDDESLLNFCQTDKYIKSLCDNDNFWERRAANRYGESVSKPYNKTWREQYLFLINHYNFTREYDNNVVTVHAKKNFITLNRYITIATGIYNEEYFDEFDLKPDTEIREIIGHVVAEAATYFGNMILVRYDERIDVFEFGNVFGIEGEKDSILIPNRNKQNKRKVRWSMTESENSKARHDYMDLTNGGYVTLDHGFDDGYVYVPSLRVAGRPDDIINYFIEYGVPPEQIQAHVDRSYNIDNINNIMKMPYEHELRELARSQLQQLPQLPVLGIPLPTLPVNGMVADIMGRY